MFIPPWRPRIKVQPQNSGNLGSRITPPTQLTSRVLLDAIDNAVIDQLDVPVPDFGVTLEL